MFRFIAFLRAINVGSGRTVKMQSLRQVFESLGFSRVATFIASGNVVFETTTKKTKTLERKIERALKDGLGYEVRTRKDHRGVDLISDALLFGRRHLAAGAIVNTDKENFLFHRLLREL